MPSWHCIWLRACDHDAAQVEVEGERAGKRPRKKVPVIRTLCEIPALMLPSKPSLMSSFGQGQANTMR
jgi:hypothetical protein